MQAKDIRVSIKYGTTSPTCRSRCCAPRWTSSASNVSSNCSGWISLTREGAAMIEPKHIYVIAHYSDSGQEK